MWPMKRQEKATRNRAAPPPRGLLPAATPDRPLHRKGGPRCAPASLRGVREARDAIALARLLRGTITPLRADDVLALLEPHRPRLVPKAYNPLAAMVGQPQGRMLDALLRPVAPIVMDVLLPHVRDHLIDRLVGGKAHDEEGLPSAVDVADAMRSLVTLLRGGGRGTVLAVVAAVEADGREDADRITRATAPASPGGIDDLARALLRFEVRRLVLETLGATTALQDVIYQSRRLSRFALRRATEAIEGFVADRGIKALHASLATLASVDGLIVIVMRNLDDQEESREEASPFVEPADRKALNDYLSAAWRLSDMLFDLVGKAAAGGELDDLLFEALLRQLRGLHHFCADLDHTGRPATLDTLEQQLVARTESLARLAGERLIETMLTRPAAPASARRLLGRGRSLAQLLHDMGRDDELEELAMRLVMARDALEQAG
ncbi:hypothetical protein [Azospirillum soli]|uniref:hypothetical protein n=1 Tax=Azospirillum soli TaxID=1304799 RepID=UPI001AE290DF|nr:hypothetical protein [Azospirillum soli]MBP2312099.1 hypothetical protein [Azospirillum soli]